MMSRLFPERVSWALMIAQRNGGESIERMIERPPIGRSDKWVV